MHFFWLPGLLIKFSVFLIVSNRAMRGHSLSESSKPSVVSLKPPDQGDCRAFVVSGPV